jgi:hypothetical protein
MLGANAQFALGQIVAIRASLIILLGLRAWLAPLLRLDLLAVANRVLIPVLISMLILVTSVLAQTTSAPFTKTDLSIVVDIAVRGKVRHFLLDTGCGLTVASADTVGWSSVDVMKAAPAHLIVWVDGSIHSMGSVSTTLEIGQTLIVTPVVVANLDPLSKSMKIKLDGILGEDVLSHFSRIIIDNKNKRLILEK